MDFVIEFKAALLALYAYARPLPLSAIDPICTQPQCSMTAWHIQSLQWTITITWQWCNIDVGRPQNLGSHVGDDRSFGQQPIFKQLLDDQQGPNGVDLEAVKHFVTVDVCQV